MGIFESLLEHFIYRTPKPPAKRAERLLPINIHAIKFGTPYLQILYTPMSRPLYNCITVCKYEFDKSMLVCANKMRQLINDLYLLFLRIKNLASFFLRKNILIYFFKNLRLSPPPPPPLFLFLAPSKVGRVPM